LTSFIEKQLDRSMLVDQEDAKEEFAQKMVDIVIAANKDGKPVYKPEGLIIAGFIADKGGE
jgi:hypothetical protein